MVAHGGQSSRLKVGEPLSVWLAIVVPITGVVLGAAIALYNISGERRDLSLKARERSLRFCAELADVCDGIIASRSYPSLGSLPPVRASLLLYLRNGFQVDLMHQYRAGHMFEGLSLPIETKGLEIANQISDTCVALHLLWEDVVGVEISHVANPSNAPKRDANEAKEASFYCAQHLRERVTLLYQVIASYRLTTRSRAVLYMAFELMPEQLSYSLRSRLSKSREEKDMSVTGLLG